MSGRRVLVTGIGVVSPHGNDPERMFDALMAGRSAVAAWPRAAAPAVVAATASFDPSPWFSALQLAGVDRVSQMAVAAATMALQDANGELIDEADNCGVYVGCGLGGAGAMDEAYRRRSVGQRVPPLTVVASMTNAPAAHIAMRHGIAGPSLTYSVACASSSIAIGEAAKAIRCGDIEVAIAGGAEALMADGPVSAWQALQTLAAADPDAPGASCRPFARDRSGFALGEGAAFLILESEAHALARDARCYAELAGYGLSCDASHMTKPDVRGQVKAIAGALRSARLAPRDIGYCNAHGTATRAGDVVECQALNRVWGDDIATLRVSSTKALHGHLLGGAGALEAAITVLALHHRKTPPSAHCRDQDDDCDVELVKEPGRDDPTLFAALSNSFAFGGSNAVLAFRRP